MTQSIKKIISIVLTVCLMLGGSGLSALLGSVAYADNAPTTAEANYKQYRVKLTADPVTDTAPAGFGAAASDGRIWTDKSVTAENDGTFNIQLSALAQEYMTSNSTNPGVGGNGNANGSAADVTFILDMSSSMGNLSGKEIADTSGGPGLYYRVEAMAKAANEAIRTVMNANPNNRVAVYWFGGSASSNHLGTFMELGHYQFNSGHETEDYLKYATNQTITLNSNLTKDGSAVGSKSAVSLGGGTPTQDGIMYGVSKTMSNIGTKGEGPKRQPYLFLLSDGAAIHAKKAWYNSPKGKSFETDFVNAVSDATTVSNYNQNGTDGSKYVPETAGTGLASTGHPEIAALTILTGAYMKNLMDHKYTEYNGGESTQSKVYTVGLGSTTAINGPYNGNQPVYAWAGLDPKRVDTNKEDSNYNYGTAKNTYDMLKTYAVQGPIGFNYAESFVYSNYYTFAPTYDIVKSAFSGLTNDVEATTTILPLLNIPETTDLGNGAETADIASAIVVADDISNDFAVDLSTLKIGDAVATVDTSTNINGGTAYAFAGYGSKAVIKTVAGVSSLTWYIDADDMQSHIYRFKNRTSPQPGDYSVPAGGSFKISYKVKPTFQVSPNQVGDTSRYINAGNASDGAKTAAYFHPPADSPYYQALTSKQTVSKTGGIGATYVTEESLNNGKAIMRLGNNGKLDLQMGIMKTGPATVPINGSIDYKVTLYNYTNSAITGLSVTSDGQNQTGIDVQANDNRVLTFTKTAPGTPQTLDSDTAVITGINLVSNTVSTDVTNVTTAEINTHVIRDVGGTVTGGGTYNVGESATITAVPVDGFTFAGWYDNQAGTGTPVSTDAVYTFTVQNDQHYYAKYTLLPFASDDTYSVVRGTTLTIPAEEGILLNDTDSEGRVLTAVSISSISDSTKGTLSVDPEGSFTFAAEAEASGSVTFTYQADNGSSRSNVATVTINITPPAHKPTASNDSYNVRSGGTLNVPVEGGLLSNDTDDENHPLTVDHVSSISDTSKGTLNVNPDGSFTFVAEANASGNVTFTYEAYDGTVYSSSATVTITIKVPITTHVIGDVGGTTDGDGVYRIGESAMITAIPASGYAFVGWYDNEEGTGTPVSTGKAYSLTVSSAGDYYAKFSQLPTAENDSYKVVAGATLTVSVEKGILLNDITYVDNGNLTAVDVSSLSESNKGTLNVNLDGSFTFAAAREVSGSVTFKYRASDAAGKSNEATVTITFINPSIDGTITVKETQKPVSGAIVILRDLAGKETGRTTTDVNGKYTFEDVIMNNYVLEVVRDGYSPAHREVSVSTANVSPNGHITEDFELVDHDITLTANPSSILGNGISTSVFKTVITDKEGRPQAGVEVVFEVPNTTYGHFTGNTNTITVLTDAEGVAKTTFTAAVLGGTGSVSIPLTATVDDSQKGIQVSDTIYITITPGVITGVVTDQAGQPLAGSSIKVSKDFDGDGIADFHAVAVTGADGAYTIAIPQGNVTYDVSITKLVEVSGQKKSVIFNQSVPVNGSVDGHSFDANKTVSGVVLVGKTQGASAMLDGTVGGGYNVLINDGNGDHTGQVNQNGTFNIDSVLKGNYTAKVVYNIPLPGGGTQPIVVGHVNTEINADGQISISEVLIDPYGTITDSVTGQPITGAVVTLHYSNGTVVNLPPVNNFPPADNANPQTSDATGQYAFMVFPHTDYYLTAKKAGYKDFDSRVVDPSQPLIHVGTDIVLYNFSMTPLTTSGGSGSGTSTGASNSPTNSTPPSTVPTTTTPSGSIDLAIAILVDKMKGGEGDTLTFTVIYANKTTVDADGVYVKAKIPSGLSLVDANGGALTGQELKWNVGKLTGGTQGKLTFKLKVNDMNEGEDFGNITANIGTDHKLTLTNTQDDASLIKVMLYSNRYEHQHARYIMGYPDGNVKPGRLITRAEIAAIFARTLQLQDEVRHVQLFSDVAASYWGADYIEAVVNKEIFKGYADNTFKPDQPITRAELATAIARYLGVARELKMNNILRISSFTDISGSWAEQSIDEVYRFGFLSGYKNGSFQPNSRLTREEAVKMINGMLYRGPLTGVQASYPDNRMGRWSFGHLEEATRTHTYKINEDGSETMLKYIPEDLW
ncbi:Ig-like domain-containing protein [Paenibacillus polysaccharolyticus]|uniref:Ig-like domain-containing protein n=1 Tax=Paenibacillus polysaccharolyticus TaxID=582692 RepID=UPI0020412DE1|nr:Ig-like domain-containing protein [Paenibacillus polysaccharolyticus]MCM3134413.1 Ig-like domain-containing protein [Paenibacillus polysaccharolyticus]